MREKIQNLRKQIDVLNIKILELLSERAEVAEKIGEAQTDLGLSHYDPAREQEMLDALVATNEGPFDEPTVKSLFKQIFQASMQLEDDHDKKKYLTSRTRERGDTVVKVGEVKGSGGVVRISAKGWWGCQVSR